MSSKSYDDYEREYNANLSRVRAFLAASNRPVSTLKECDRLLGESRQCAIAMVGMAEVEGDILKIDRAKQLLERDVTPLLKEVTKALDEGGSSDGGRQELFAGYNAPDPFGPSSDTDRLIQDSESLLRETQALCAESEQIGESTLHRLGMQREQLQIASGRLEDTANAADQARMLMMEMGRRAFRNKMFLYFVITLLVFANCAMLYRLFFKKH